MKPVFVTGLMSGSSLDGVDLAYCSFRKSMSGWEYEVLEAETLPYPSGLRKMLTNAEHISQERFRELDMKLGRYYATLLNDFHRRIGTSPGLIASHGHTLLHRPEEGLTFQAGNGIQMAGITGITVVNDFRREDVAQGGQGAPLVPVGDKLLFGEYDACLNLGGFANISFDNKRGERIAYDTGPANLALNWSARKSGMEYDLDGALAASGQLNRDLLHQLNSLNYYGSLPPKSLGREWFSEHFLPILEETELKPESLQATLTEHVGFQAAKAILDSGAGTVLLSGGGAFNRTLVESIKRNCSAPIIIPDPVIINYKEALVFAFLGLLRTKGEINCLRSVSGGKKDLSCGIIHQA